MANGFRFLTTSAILAGASILASSPAAAGMLDSKCHPLGLLGGYRQHDLGNRTFQISVVGNGFAGRDFPKACMLERARAIAVEHGVSRFAVVRFKGTITYRRGTGGYVGGSTKTVIKLLDPGETAAPIKNGEVFYFDVASMQPESPVDLQPAVPMMARVAGTVETRPAPPRAGAPVDVLGLLSDPEHFN